MSIDQRYNSDQKTEPVAGYGAFGHLNDINLAQWITIAALVFAVLVFTFFQSDDPLYLAFGFLLVIGITVMIVSDPVSCTSVLYLCDGIIYFFRWACILAAFGWGAVILLGLTVTLGPIVPLIFVVFCVLAYLGWRETAYKESPEHDAEFAALDHEVWLRFKVADGWTYGKIESACKKTSPLIIPFKLLPDKIQAVAVNNARVVKKLSAGYDDNVVFTAETQWDFMVECRNDEAWDHTCYAMVGRDGPNRDSLPYSSLSLEKKIKLEEKFKKLNEIKKTMSDEQGVNPEGFTPLALAIAFLFGIVVS